MSALLTRVPFKVWAIGGIALAAVLLFAALKYQTVRADRAEGKAAIATTTATQLDNVATETPAIREEQKEKQDAVETINGADAPLPAGFGADLERVRRGQRDNHPR